MTARQFDAWMEWEMEDINIPSRTDHYLMRIAMEVRGGNVKPGTSINPRDFFVKFDRPDRPVVKTEEQKRLEVEQDKAIALARVSRVGKRPTKE